MKRQAVSTVELKAKKNEMSYKQLVKYPLEAMKAKMDKVKSGIINPESSFKNPFSHVNRLEMRPSTSKLELHPTDKKQPFKIFPQKKHILSTHEFDIPAPSKSRNAGSDEQSEQFNQTPLNWNPNTKPKPEYQLAFKNLPPANYFTTESQRRIICDVFEELDDILDNQRFSAKLKRILQQRENDIEAQKRFKRFKRRKQNEAINKMKLPSSSGETEIRLNRQYNLSEIWSILKPHWLKHGKINKQQFDTEEFPCAEFVTFLSEVGFENQNMVRQFFDEMASVRLQAVNITSESSSTNSRAGVASLLKVHLFLANFQKYVNNNSKILYLHSKSAAFTRNVTLKNYIAQWHTSYPQIKLKLKQKKQKEQTSLLFIQELKANEEDEIIFELEENLEKRQALYEKPNNSYKETEVQQSAINLIEGEIKRAQDEIAVIHDEIRDRVKGQMERRRELVIQKRQFCSLLTGVEVFNSVGDFLDFLSAEIVEAEYKRDTLSGFCETFVDDKEKFIEPLVTLLEIADFMFRQNYDETQTAIISRFVDLLKANFRSARNLPENEVIKSAQRMPMKIFRASQAEAIAKKELKVALLYSFKQKVTEHFQKNLAIKVSHVNQTKNNNAEMNFVYEYLLKHLHAIDNRLEKCDVSLSQIVEYFDMMEEREQVDHLGAGELDIDDKYHNLLEKILYDIFAILGEDVPQHLTFLIDTRTFKHNKFIESLAQIGTKISNYISQTASPSSVKDSKSPQNSKYLYNAAKQDDNVKEAEENEEQDYLLNVFNKRKTAESTANKSEAVSLQVTTQKEHPKVSNSEKYQFPEQSVGKFFSPSVHVPSKHLRNSAVSDAKQSSQMNTAFKSTGMQDNIPSARGVTNTTNTANSRKYDVFDILEGENQAQQVIKNIKNTSSMLSRQQTASTGNLKTMKHSYSTRFDDYKLEYPPEYYNLHPMKAESEEFKVYMDKKQTKFPSDIDRKVQKFQMEVQLDEAKRKLRLGK